jgi:hypothetical protein
MKCENCGKKFSILECGTWKDQNGRMFCCAKCMGEKNSEIELVKDYDREYTIQEVFEFEEGTEFVDEYNKPIRVKTMALESFDNDEEGQEPFWGKCLITQGWLSSKFKLKRKEREVGFMEAIEALFNGSKIMCRIMGEEYEYNGKNCSGLCGYDIHTNYMKNGKWYIQD